MECILIKTVVWSVFVCKKAQRLGVETEGVSGAEVLFGLKNECWRESRLNVEIEHGALLYIARN